MVKIKSMIKALLQKNYLNINKRQKQISVFIFLAFLYLGQVWLILPSQAASLWNAQVGRQEIGGAFGNNGTPESVTDIVVRVIRYLLTFFGLLMTVIIIWAGARWMTAGGDEKKVETAKSHLIAAVIGGIIIISAYVITTFVARTAGQMISDSLWW